MATSAQGAFAILERMQSAAVDEYLARRTGSFETRAVRYRAALRALTERGLSDDSTLYDIGAGWTELDVVLRTDGSWRGRYIPVDLGTCGSDLETWVPPRRADFAVALEVLEHLEHPWRLVDEPQAAVDVLVVSVPDPDSVDVLGMDPTHRTVIGRRDLEARGFTVTSALFYGGHYSAGRNDALFAVWAKV